MRGGVEDVPALLSGGLDDGAHGGQAGCALAGAEAASGLLTQLDQCQVAFRLVVRNADTAGTALNVLGRSRRGMYFLFPLVVGSISGLPRQGRGQADIGSAGLADARPHQRVTYSDPRKRLLAKTPRGRGCRTASIGTGGSGGSWDVCG